MEIFLLNPIFMCLYVVALVLVIFGLRKLREHASTVMTEKSAASLMISSSVSLLFFCISVFTVFMDLKQYLTSKPSVPNLPILLIFAGFLGIFVELNYTKVFDAYGFITSVIPCVLFIGLGALVLFLSSSLILIFLGLFLLLAGAFSGYAVYGALQNSYTPKFHKRRFYCLRLTSFILAPPIAYLIVHLAGARFALIISIIFCGITYFALGYVFLVIRQSHFTLTTPEGEKIAPKIAEAFADPSLPPVTWNEYPRPQQKRQRWQNLNGVWKLNHHEIYVPFPPESDLSGYGKPVTGMLNYERNFTLDDSWSGERILLHFGAVDQTCEVFVNDSPVGSHQGGYLPFTFDITEYVHFGSENKLEVRAKDFLSSVYPYGKQRLLRGGMWYTPVSGIWQTVWLEPVPKTYIERLKLTPSMTGIKIKVVIPGQPETISRTHVDITLSNDEHYYYDTDQLIFTIDMTKIKLANGSFYEPRLWSPEDPYLYKMTVRYADDTIETYFGLREIGISTVNHIPRVVLNNKPVFLHGVLDQGYFPDGIFTPGTHLEYLHDIIRMKELGFNCVRKHIKVEPEIFYYLCDTYGLLVIQDMVNSGTYNFVRDTMMPAAFTKNKPDRGKGGSEKRKSFFIQHCIDTCRALHEHPSIIAYTIFNEGWGQFDSDIIFERLKQQDASRLYDSTSGWFTQKKSDFDSYHQYFTNSTFPMSCHPLLISECGGFSYMVPEHYFSKYNHFSYGISENTDQLMGAIENMYTGMVLPSIKTGGSGCIYTQLTDVEDETNGLFTYDRKVTKVDPDRMNEIRRSIDKAMSEI